MKGTLLLNYNENTKKIEEEERYSFLRNLIEQMGVPIQEFWTTNEPLTIEQKIKLRGILQAYSIQVIDDLDGHMQVFVEKDMVGEWHKPNYKLKKDLSEIDRRKQLYLEMSIEYWSVFEKEDLQE